MAKGHDVSDDLIFQDEIRDLVRSAYRAITTGAGRAMAERFYSGEELASVPGGAVDWALGVGNPVRHAGLSAGEVVLDIGSGGGIDTVLAAQRVGPAGRVIGLDMLTEMTDRARAAVDGAGMAGRCEFREGEMEAIPLPDESIDVVVSNGVINLSPRKSRAFAEIARVLRPGGRFCVSDLVVNDDLPPEVLSSGAAWAGCIAGALSERVFADKLERAGLIDIEMSGRSPLSLDDVALYPLFTPEVLSLMRRLLPDATRQHIATSVIARARKPTAQGPSTPPPAPG
jgi:SAM-dependent methyltransferase